MPLSGRLYPSILGGFVAFFDITSGPREGAILVQGDDLATLQSSIQACLQCHFSNGGVPPAFELALTQGCYERGAFPGQGVVSMSHMANYILGSNLAKRTYSNSTPDAATLGFTSSFRLTVQKPQGIFVLKPELLSRFLHELHKAHAPHAAHGSIDWDSVLMNLFP